MSRKSKAKSRKTARRGTRSGSPRKRRWPSLADVFLSAGFLLIPLVFVPGVADEFRLPKLAAAELLFGLSCLTLVLRGAVQFESGRLRSYLLATVPFVAVAFASVMVGDHGAHGRIALWSMLFGWMVGICWSGIPLELERVLRLMTPPAILVSLIAAAQGLELWSPISIEETRRRLQITSTIGNSGELASYLVLPAVFAAWRALQAWNRGEGARSRFGWPLALVLMLGAITATQTATALLLVVIVVGGLVALQPRRIPVRVGLIVAAAVCLGVVLLSPAASRVTVKLGELAGGEWADLTSGRTDGWTVATRLLFENPVVGVGFGGFAAEYTASKLELAEEGTRFFTKHVGQSTFGNAHSEPLEVAAEMGGLGLVALLWLVAAVVMPFVRRWRAASNPDEREPLLLQAAVLVAMSGLAMTYFPMRTALLAYPFLFSFVALLPRSRGPVSEEESGQHADAPVRSDRRRWWAAALVVLLLVQSGRVSWQRIRSSAELRGAESLAQSMIQGGRVYPTVLRKVIPNLEQAFEWTPWDERLPQALAGYYVLLRDGENARSWYERSFEVAYRPETIDSMGRLLHSAGQVDEAIPWLVRAVRLDPRRIRSVPKDVRAQVRRLAFPRAAINEGP